MPQATGKNSKIPKILKLAVKRIRTGPKCPHPLNDSTLLKTMPQAAGKKWNESHWTTYHMFFLESSLDILLGICHEVALTLQVILVFLTAFRKSYLMYLLSIFKPIFKPRPRCHICSAKLQQCYHKSTVACTVAFLLRCSCLLWNN